MGNLGQNWVISLVTLLLALCTPYSDAYTETASKVKSVVFYSPKVELTPGISSNKFYYDVKFPKGHVAIKSFNGEVVDDEGNSVPLYEVYLHHWLVARNHQHINSTSIDDIVLVKNAGISNGPNGLNVTHNCQIEYDIDRCNTTQKHYSGCTDVKKTSFPMIKGGYVIYGVARQHAGGLGSTLYGQDGRVICISLPKYEMGKQAGNEKGYIFEMTTCYPQPGSVKIMDRETLTLVSDYSNSELHTGLMGLFYFLLAERL
ncbi:hypothetical protein L6164_037216 [Bauhinia variegata]|uniref:Uncharacterized protein n=1 Tax=Bauhinia variegata TaxID=167791 RepID=A0ACB9KJI2_BAUVA|nr:hypothetical protein L6164_037216 [Bauhinia variegata]